MRVFATMSCLLLSVCVATALPFGAPAAAPGRAVLPPGQHTNMSPKLHLPSGFNVTYAASGQDLVNCLLGADVQVRNVTLNAAPVAAGTFIGGGPVLGFDSGIVLSSGDIASIVGPNVLNDVTTDNLRGGDPDLDALVAPDTTYDATILEFDFLCASIQQVSFQYVFASDEYNEYANTIYDDVFAFFLNGNAVANNIAIVPNYCQTPGIPVAVNNVNCNNPYAPPTGTNCGCYRNNALPDGGGSLNTEMDGLTVSFTATSAISPGWNHIKLAIADSGDHVLDSNVMIRCQSFVCGNVPVTPMSWGGIKALYR